MKQSKGTLTSMKVILTILFVSQTEAAFDVSLDVIGQVDNKLTLVCGQNVTFVCSVKPVTNSMDWFIDTMTVATCKAGFCTAQGILPANANFEYSTSEGIYNLTFSPVLASDDAREYKCQFGSDKKSIIPTVTVFPDESFSVITNASNANDINITVSTCVSSSDFVSFKWYIFKAGESRKLFDTSMNLLKNVSSCQSTSNCNGEMSTSTITIKNLKEENGDFFFFQIEILYTYSSDAQPYRVTVDSPTQYKISVNSDVTDDGNGLSCEDIIFIVVMCVTRVYAIQTAILVYQEQARTAPHCTGQAFSFLLNIPVFGLIPLLVVIMCYSTETGGTNTYPNSRKRLMLFTAFALFFGVLVSAFDLYICILYINHDILRKTRFIILYVVVVLLTGTNFSIECVTLRKIGQDDNRKGVLIAAFVVSAINLVFLRSEYLLFLKESQCCVNSSKYCCRRSVPVGIQKRTDPVQTTAHNYNSSLLLKHQIIAGKDEICCDRCKFHASNAYCVTDGLYLCKTCLKKCKPDCVRLWIYVDKIDEHLRLCCKEHNNLNDLMLEGVCSDCNQFICRKCMNRHETKKCTCTRHQQIHETFSDGTRIISNPQETWSEDYWNTLKKLGLFDQTKNCMDCHENQIECLEVQSKATLCADCFEKGTQSKGRLNSRKIITVLGGLHTYCKVHKVLGKGEPLLAEAFCFVCNLYMCVECFKKHRRIYDHWSKNLEDNLFYCKCDDMFPVVGFHLVDHVFKCAKCFQSKTSKTMSLPVNVRNKIDEVTGSADYFQCQTDRSNVERIPCKAEVYCLVCKLIMCRTCFFRHTKYRKRYEKM